MVCKEEVVTLFKEFSSYKRVDLMCTLLNMCLPFELRFLGTCLEELGKRDYSQLRESESRANNQAELADVTCVADKHARRILTVYLSLLHTNNQTCSSLIFKTLASLASDDFAELGRVLSGECARVSGGPPEEPQTPGGAEDNPLEELLLLYSMALNHPAFSFEQKALFGNVLLRLQDEETKTAYPQKRLVCVKTGMPPMYMPCAPCTISADGSGSVAQHFAPGKSFLFPATAVATGRFAGDKGLQEMTGPYFVATTPMFCSVPPPNMVSPVPPTPGTPSDFSVCPPAPFVVPAMPQPPCQQPDIVAASVNASYPVNDSPYASPSASPPRSPNVSRCESPVVWNTTTGQPTTTYKNCYTSPNHNESSSSSSTCSGGSTKGGGGGSAFRNSRSTNHIRCKQNVPNGQLITENPAAIPTMKIVEPLRIPGEESLPEIMSGMTLGAVNGGMEPNRGQRMHGEDKRCWNASGNAIAPNSGSAGSSQSATPSPPITPPQEEQWDHYKEESVGRDAQRWEKANNRGMGVGPSGMSRFNHPRGPPMRRMEHHQGAKGPGRQQQQQQQQQPPLSMHSSYFLPALQPVQANGHTFYPHGQFFLPLMTAHGAASGPASFPPSYATPNGNLPPGPPDYMSMPPAPSQKSPPPFPAAAAVHPSYLPPNSAKQNYVHSYPPHLAASNHKESCFNCGGVGHRGSDCSDPTIQDVLKKGMYHLDYASPQSSETVVGGVAGMLGGAPPAASLEK